MVQDKTMQLTSSLHLLIRVISGVIFLLGAVAVQAATMSVARAVLVTEINKEEFDLSVRQPQPIAFKVTKFDGPMPVKAQMQHGCVSIGAAVEDTAIQRVKVYLFQLSCVDSKSGKRLVAAIKGSVKDSDNKDGLVIEDLPDDKVQGYKRLVRKATKVSLLLEQGTPVVWKDPKDTSNQ